MSEQRSTAPSATVIRGVRRAAIIAIIVSLAVAALLGIIALLSGEFGETQGRILLSTLVVAAFGTTALCHLATAARRVQTVGYLGIAASAVAALCAFVLIWGDWNWNYTEWLWKGLGLASVVAVSLAQANLLLLLAGRSQRLIRVTLWVTLAAIAIVALMIALPILTDGDIPGSNGDTYWRVFGVAAIIDALGTIALPILGLVLRGTATAAGGEHGPLVVTVPAEIAEQLRARAAASGTDAHALAVSILAQDAPLSAPGAPTA